MATTPSPEASSRGDDGPDSAKIAAVAAGAIGAALTLGALAIFGGKTALSVGVGALIAVANLVTLSAIIRAMLQPAEAAGTEEEVATVAGPGEDARADVQPAPNHVAQGTRGGAAWGAFALVKIIVLFGGIWVLLTRGWVDPMPLVVGYGVLPLGITASGLFGSLAPRPRRSAKTAARTR